MTKLEKVILNEIESGLVYMDYLGDGEYIRVCPLCDQEIGTDHRSYCLTHRLRMERRDD